MLSAPELTASVVPAPAAETAPSELPAVPAPAAGLATGPPELTEATAPDHSPAELFMAHTNGTAT
jgi:hypothetical protein